LGTDANEHIACEQIIVKCITKHGSKVVDPIACNKIELAINTAIATQMMQKH
jgi:hypothetical protein